MEGDFDLDEAQILVRRCRKLIREKSAERQTLQDQSDAISAESNDVHLDTLVFIDSLAPIARLTNCPVADRDFCNRLRARLSRHSDPTEQIFDELAEAANIARPVGGDSDILRFLSAVRHRHEQMSQEWRLIQEAV
jgi:hypothetical protein